jgi:hypothetical protein
LLRRKTFSAVEAGLPVEMIHSAKAARGDERLCLDGRAPSRTDIPDAKVATWL